MLHLKLRWTSHSIVAHKLRADSEIILTQKALTSSSL